MFKGNLKNWIIIDSLINRGIKIEGDIEEGRVITSRLKRIESAGVCYTAYTESGSVYLLSKKAITKGRLLNESTFATYVNMSQNPPREFVENVNSRIELYSPEEICENWEFVEKELPLEKIIYEEDEDFIIL